MKETEDTMQRRLAEGIRDSDRHAFDELFRAMYPRLVRFAFKITQDWNTSCDITQDVFVMLWQQRNTIDPDRSIRAWLFRSVRNRAYNYQRDRREIADPEVVEALTDDARNPDAPYGHSWSDDIEVSENGQETQLQKKILEWIQELPERQREAFELSRYEGLFHHEIAGVMQVSVKTVNNHLTAALRHLRSCYESYRNASENRK
ncbi:MAG: RNA polymerase sigma-70 factor [Balneolaceae bacterium]|nr:MAG: RNA polymerase sigma-70 factor [Balneolaceae bacterium]